MKGAAPRHITGAITEDPLLALPIGAKINFSAELFTSDARWEVTALPQFRDAELQ
jgi:hypothetical protein